MIETILKEHNGVYEGTTTILCDICRNGLKWGPMKAGRVPKGSHVKFMLRNKGWKLGKVHKCNKCVKGN